MLQGHFNSIGTDSFHVFLPSSLNEGCASIIFTHILQPANFICARSPLLLRGTSSNLAGIIFGVVVMLCRAVMLV